MNFRIGTYLRVLAEFFLPSRCVVCGRLLSLKEQHICLFCDADMPLTYIWGRAHNTMADAYNAQIQENLCREPAQRPLEPYQYAAALFFYHDAAGYKEIPQSLKYNGTLSMGRFFARRLGERLAISPLYQDIDLIVPVPLHWYRRFRRGYNQAEIIAQGIAQQMSLEDKLCTKLLRRTRATRTQTKLDMEEKQRNVLDAFKADASKLPLTTPKHILLVDDVFTTGATLAQCHKALRKILPPSVRISVATLGYVDID